MGGPDTGKITEVKVVTKIMNESVQNSTSVLNLGTTRTDPFVISGDTYHYVLSLPIINGSRIQHLKKL